MPLYRLTRQRVQDLVTEVVADSPEQAVRRAYEVNSNDWRECDGSGLAPIDSVSEADKDSAGRCWGVQCEGFSETVHLDEVDE